MGGKILFRFLKENSEMLTEDFVVGGKIIEFISNHGAQYAVGSMSRFVDGKPDKSGYRKFKIKTVSGRDDYAMIAEIVKRRYYRLSEFSSDNQ